MKRWWYLFFPILWSVSPVLFLYTHNYGELSSYMLVRPLCIVIGLAIAIWGIFFWWSRSAADASLATSFVVLMIMSYGHLFNTTAFGNTTVTFYAYTYFVIWLLVLIVGVILLRKYSRRLSILSEILNGASVVLAIFMVVTFISIERARVIHYDAANMPAHEEGLHHASDTSPNIFYIILDMYARGDVLADLYQHDNEPFLQGLRDRGFYIAEHSHSNYPQTILSIPSSLNMTYFTQLGKKMGISSQDRKPLEEAAQTNLVCRTLKSLGYKIVALPSEYLPLSLPSDVDMQGMEAMPDFYTALLNTTPALLLSLTATNSSFDRYATHRRVVLWQFATVPAMARKYAQGPTFVFAHILAPHPPIVFDAKGNLVRGNQQTASTAGTHWNNPTEKRMDYCRKYGDEVSYLNTRILEMVDGILAASRRPTVIILQGDHGPWILPDNDSANSISVHERFSIFNAYRLPNGGEKALYPTITPVNSFRIVFNTYLNMHLPLLPDQNYFTGFLHPYHFIDETQVLSANPRPVPAPPISTLSTRSNRD